MRRDVSPAAGRLALALVLVAAPAVPLSAQHDHGADAANRYADLLDRDIKALSPEEIAQLRAGEGMGMALPAELNGLPGPRHVLDLADDLGLGEDVRVAVREIFEGMRSRAVALGTRIIEVERELDRRFASGAITAEEVRGLTRRIAALRGELRAVHLEAHIATAGRLSAEERHRYDMLRGYHVGTGR